MFFYLINERTEIVELTRLTLRLHAKTFSSHAHFHVKVLPPYSSTFLKFKMVDVNALVLHLKSVATYLKDPWTLSWVIGGISSVFIPVIVWSNHRSTYFNNIGYAQKAEDYYEEQQRYYEQQKEYYEQKKNGYYGNGNDDGNNQSYYKDCSWINWPCRRRQWLYATYSQDDEGDGQPLPSWYVFLGGETEQMEKWREENTGQRARGNSVTYSGLNFAYFLTMALFLGLLAYGAMTLGKKEPITNLTVFLVLCAVIGLMNLIMSMGTISTDNRDLEDSYYGWYGQTGVLLVYTNFSLLLFSFAFLIAFQVRNYLDRKAEEKEETAVGEVEGDYHAPSDAVLA